MLSSGALGCALYPERAVRAQTPVQGRIPIAFVIGPVSNLIDIAGPWEVFGDLWETKIGHQPPPRGADHFESVGDVQPVFAPYLVSDTLELVKAGNRIRMTPDCTYASAPAPRIVVMGAQSGHTPQKLEWIREMSRTADVVMSVCTGAYVLAATGLLDGRRATTHHDFYDDFAETYPRVELVRGPRFIDDGKLKTAGGLTSGINLAVHVVGQMFGSERAAQIAHYLEFVATERA